MKPFADLHCHPTLHTFAFEEANKKRKNSLWWDNPPLKRQRKSNFPEYFQTSMPAFARGNVRLVIAALYPIEQAWLDPKILGTGDITDVLAKQVVSHLPVRYINKVQSPEFKYYEYLNKEYEFLLKDNGKVHKTGGIDWKYIVAKNSNDIDKYKNEDHTVVFVPAIEGAHSLIMGNANQLISDPIIHSFTINNIAEIKEWDHPPLYITLSHHYYNGMIGQARSIPDGAASFLLNQQIGLNEPVNQRGEEVIDCLLGINQFEGNGRRILIDTKHMSIAARIWYYEKISNYNKGKSEDQKIPIIASHMGYGGHKSLLDSIEIPDMYGKKYEHSKVFNPWSINLSNEEIAHIVNSNGIIGLNLDQRVLSGNAVIEQSKKISKCDIRNNRSNVVAFWTNQVAENLLGIINAIQNSNLINNEKKENAWNYISIGSDFDGMINPVDAFIVADEFKNLREALTKYMPEMNGFNSASKNLSIEEIMDKVMYDNVLDFVRNNYY